MQDSADTVSPLSSELRGEILIVPSYSLAGMKLEQIIMNANCQN